MFWPPKDEAALKQKLRRLCSHNKAGELKVPQWLHDAWKNGDHLAMALQYQACGFNKAGCVFCSCVLAGVLARMLKSCLSIFAFVHTFPFILARVGVKHHIRRIASSG